MNGSCLGSQSTRDVGVAIIVDKALALEGQNATVDWKHENTYLVSESLKQRQINTGTLEKLKRTRRRNHKSFKHPSCSFSFNSPLLTHLMTRKKLRYSIIQDEQQEVDNGALTSLCLPTSPQKIRKTKKKRQSVQSIFLDASTKTRTYSVAKPRHEPQYPPISSCREAIFQVACQCGYERACYAATPGAVADLIS